MPSEFVELVITYGATALTEARLSAATVAGGGRFVSTDSLGELRAAITDNKPRLVLIDTDADDYSVAAALIRQKTGAELVFVVGAASDHRDRGACALHRQHRAQRSPAPGRRHRDHITLLLDRLCAILIIERPLRSTIFTQR